MLLRREVVGECITQQKNSHQHVKCLLTRFLGCTQHTILHPVAFSMSSLILLTPGSSPLLILSAVYVLWSGDMRSMSSSVGARGAGRWEGVYAKE